ncbi:MAG: DUF5916 domain-containing protein, partial [Candidatus Poribacteria bacterium]|nr:DUF5916 domain-containing protein [Candidatus Poribacteria bacterium]
DFAQVEADREYVNLSRFSLFFPEKRPFFLEGSNFFEFGISGSSLSRSPPLLLFYSRNIGIDQGRMVPIIAGGKLTGKVGSYGLGFLNVMTDQLKEPSEELSIDRTNFSVVRLRKDLLTSSSVGVIATNRQSSADNYNRTGGVDFLYRPSETLTFNGLMATSTDRDQQGQAFYLGGGWRSDKIRASTGYSAIDPDFVPGVGFAERGGGRRLRGELRWAPWVSDMGDWIRPALERIHLREIWSGPETDISFNNEQEVETVILRYLHWMNFKSGDWIAIDIQNTVDRLEQPFDVHSDHQIPAGEYVYTRFWLTTETAETRIISARISVGHGQYYHGQRSGLNGFLTFKPNGYFSLESSYSLNRVKLPDGSFNANVIGGRLVCSLSTLAYAKLFVQWNSESERLSTNLLLNYIYQPGSDFYLVLNQIYNRAQGQRLVDRAILAKLTYWYQ